MDTYRVVVDACDPIIHEFTDLSDLIEFTDTLCWEGKLFYEYTIYEGFLDLPPHIRAIVLSRECNGDTIGV